MVDVSHGADVVVGRAGMKSMRDLKGKSVAVESGALGAFVLSRALAINGMQASDVNVVHLESNEQPARSRRAGSTAPSLSIRFARNFCKAGATTLFDSTQIPGEIVDLSRSRERPRRAPEAMEALLAGWFGASTTCARSRRTRRGAWASASRPAASSSSRRRGACTFRSRDENLTMLGGHIPGLVVTGRRLMALMLDAKLLRAASSESRDARAGRRWRGLPR